MMNTLSECFEYASTPWIDIDRTPFNINYFSPVAVGALLETISSLKCANIAKSHHHFDFFKYPLPKILDLHVLYVYRQPADVLASLWRFLKILPWVEGPKVGNLIEFAKSPPMGQMMRYQYTQQIDMLERWASHVESWLNAATENRHISTFRYEDLVYDFDGSVARIASSLKLERLRLAAPSRKANVVAPGPIPFGGDEVPEHRSHITDLAEARYPELMKRLSAP